MAMYEVDVYQRARVIVDAPLDVSQERLLAIARSVAQPDQYEPVDRPNRVQQLPHLPAEELAVVAQSGPHDSVVEGMPGVRVIHLPTGLAATSTGHRSRLQNEVAALGVLKELVQEAGAGE